MKTITKIFYVTLGALAFTCFALSPIAQAQLELPPPNANLFASINGFTTDCGFDQNFAGAIYQYTPAGVQSTFWAGFSRPRGVAFDSAGNLFVATNFFGAVSIQSTIVKFLRGIGTTFATLSDNFYAEGLAIDGADNIFVVAIDVNDPNLASTIFKFASDGTQSTFGSVPGQGFGCAFDTADNLFVASGDQTVYEFTTDGTRSIFVDPTAFPPDQGPVGLAFDGLGNLFVSTEPNGVPPPSGDGLILEFAPDGTGTTFADVHNYARGLAFDSEGNLFVAEVGINGVSCDAPGDILKFAPDGTRTVFASGIGNLNAGPEFLTFHLPITSRFRPRPTPAPRPRPTSQFQKHSPADPGRMSHHHLE